MSSVRSTRQLHSPIITILAYTLHISISSQFLISFPFIIPIIASQNSIISNSSFIGDSVNKYFNHTLLCNDDTNCTIDCNDFDNSCRNANIKCPLNGNCDITCKSGTSSHGLSHNVCKGINITCPINGNCNISCYESSACQDAHIDARYATSVSLICGSSSPNTCSNLAIYLPPNMNGNKKAFIQTNSAQSLQFYAQYGWNDIDIKYNGTYIQHEGIMHCESDYSSSCAFKSDAWACANDTDICNNPPLFKLWPIIHPSFSEISILTLRKKECILFLLF